MSGQSSRLAKLERHLDERAAAAGVDALRGIPPERFAALVDLCGGWDVSDDPRTQKFEKQRILLYIDLGVAAPPAVAKAAKRWRQELRGEPSRSEDEIALEILCAEGIAQRA